ncbi:MAG: zinc-dependent metalloprotease, partial [Candidatus Aminicenantes bacterium]|nr:zinc-dependent metalloprotease [Candidatus Aminicenantes bacterium]
ETEAVGDIDPVEATRLGIKNLKRVMDMLPAAVLKPGENYDQLDHMYTAVWSQLRLELGHVANLVGGYDSEPKVGPVPGVRFTPVSEARQKAAVKFISENLFKTPAWMEPAEILRKVEPTSGQARLLAVQQGILSSLLAQGRTGRLQEHEAILGSKAYTVAELLTDLRAGVFGELMVEAVKVDPYRRNLQRAYITSLGARLNPPPPAAAAGAAAAPALTNDDSRGAIRAELKAVQSLLRAKAETAADTATRNHLADLRDQITVLLDPRGVTR